jgi:hypothetical protein
MGSRLVALICLSFLLNASVWAAHSAFKDHPSPYLQQHADDAIHWQRFDEAVFAQAVKQDKLLFISSGYSACYWCHRMREDTFSSPGVGALVNADFISVLLDRELEPELDQWLQRFMEQQRGFGGWPVSVILTPDGKPLASFSYTPEQEFSETLQRFLRDWADNRPALQERAAQNHQALVLNNKTVDAPENTDLQRWLEAFLQQVNKLADQEYGGFGDQEKFPYLPQLSALLTLQQINPDPAVQDFLETSFAAMIGGGLRDHLGGGFFRYADDRDWTAPHYEQMLYTQALIAPLLLRFGEAYKQPVYVRTARETLLAMIRNFRRDDGLFRASLFATSEQGRQGGYYLWQAQDLQRILGQANADRIINLLGERETILPFILAQGETAQDIRQQLLAERNRRLLKTDDKALLGWNALALSALAAGYELDTQIQQAGQTLAQQLLALTTEQRYPRLLAEREYTATTLTDQVYLAQGLADWGRAVQDTRYSAAARRLLLTIHRDYYAQGWQYMQNNPLLGTLNQALIADSQLPSASALWLKLAWALSGSADELQQKAEQVAALLPENLQAQAFFHATHTATLVEQRYQQLQQSKGGKP